MTPLEIILIVIIWIAYGVFASARTNFTAGDDDGVTITYVMYIIFAPLVFVIKAIYGAFKGYDHN